MKCYIDRNYRTGLVTLGELFNEENDWLFQTIELPSKNNQKRISCVNTGIYIVEMDYYYKGGYPCYELRNVLDRTEIKIHIANFLHDILGCIGIGINRDEKIPMVSDSRKAFDLFMEYMQGIERFKLEIRDV